MTNYVCIVSDGNRVIWAVKWIPVCLPFNRFKAIDLLKMAFNLISFKFSSMATLSFMAAAMTMCVLTYFFCFIFESLFYLAMYLDCNWFAYRRIQVPFTYTAAATVCYTYVENREQKQQIIVYILLYLNLFKDVFLLFCIEHSIFFLFFFFVFMWERI